MEAHQLASSWNGVSLRSFHRIYRASQRGDVTSVRRNGKFRSVPSADNFKAFRQKVKAIVNNSNYGATVKAEKLAPVVRGWRNYHRFCKMDGSRNSLVHIETRAHRVFNKETKHNSESSH